MTATAGPSAGAGSAGETGAGSELGCAGTYDGVADAAGADSSTSAEATVRGTWAVGTTAGGGSGASMSSAPDATGTVTTGSGRRSPSIPAASDRGSVPVV